MAKELVKSIPQEITLAEMYALSKSNGTSSNLHNIRMRRSITTKFLEWLGKPIDETTHQDIILWRGEQEARNLKPATIYQRLSVLSSLFDFAIANGFAIYNPIAGLGSEWRKSIRPKPYSSEKVKSLSSQEVNRFLEAIDRDTEAGSRLYAQVMLMLMCGLRASEVCSITSENCNLDDDPPSIRTLCKGGIWVSFNLTSESAETIKDYLEVSGRDPKSQEPLFKNGSGPVTPHHLWREVKRVGKRAGIEGIYPHRFRHSFAQLYHESGASQPEVQGALGHRSAATTRIYLNNLAPRSAKAGRAIENVLRGKL